MSNYNVVYSDELYHHGIKGMRWGVRRFQNDDGSLTAEGKKRYGYDTGSEVYGARVSDRGYKAKTAQELSKATDSLSTLASNRSSRREKRMYDRLDVSKLSDEEMRNALNRSNLEKQYKTMLMEKSGAINRGRRSTTDILKDIGAIAATAGSVLSVAVTINQIMAASNKPDVLKKKNA